MDRGTSLLGAVVVASLLASGALGIGCGSSDPPLDFSPSTGGGGDAADAGGSGGADGGSAGKGGGAAGAGGGSAGAGGGSAGAGGGSAGAGGAAGGAGSAGAGGAAGGAGSAGSAGAGGAACTDCGGGACVDTMTDPQNCGGCNNGCFDDEYCVGGSCQCRPGLTDCNGGCIDLKHDFANCGACGNDCGSKGMTTPRCNNGVCQNNLCNNVGLAVCNNGCFSNAQYDSDPLNCGGCDNVCSVGQLCIGGNCRDYYTSPACSSCPCADCANGDACCSYGSDPAICVNAGSCP